LCQPPTTSTGEKEAEVVAEGDDQLRNVDEEGGEEEEGGYQRAEQQRVEVPVGEEV
jgi:hypothetical protein